MDRTGPTSDFEFRSIKSQIHANTKSSAFSRSVCFPKRECCKILLATGCLTLSRKMISEKPIMTCTHSRSSQRNSPRMAKKMRCNLGVISSTSAQPQIEGSHERWLKKDGRHQVGGCTGAKTRKRQENKLGEKTAADCRMLCQSQRPRKWGRGREKQARNKNKALQTVPEAASPPWPHVRRS